MESDASGLAAPSPPPPATTLVVRPIEAWQRDAAAVVLVLDAVLDLATRGAAAAGQVGGVLNRFGRPVVASVLAPPLVPKRYWPLTAVSTLAGRGEPTRRRLTELAKKAFSDTVVVVLDAVLDQVDLTQLVIRRVNIDRIVEAADIDRVAARLDFVPIVDRLPIDRVLDRVDIDGVAARIDLDKIVARLDVDGIAATIDLDAIVNRLDLAAIANEVITEIDLPELIRESSGAMASESVLGVRAQGIEADEWVNRLVDRILLRRGDRASRTQAPGDPDVIDD